MEYPQKSEKIPPEYSPYPQSYGDPQYSQSPVNPAYLQPPSNPAYPHPPANPAYPQPPSNPAYHQQSGNPAYPQPPSNPTYHNQQPSYPAYSQSSGYPQTAHPGPNTSNQNIIHNNVQSPVVVIQPSQAQPVYLFAKPYLNFTGAIIFSCVTFWLCGVLFGLIAFILAMVGQSSAASGEQASAKSMLIGSYALSIIGCVVGIIVIIVLAVSLQKQTYYYYCYYYC